MAVGFAATIKPYFTDCYHQHMLTQGPKIDLWNPATVKQWYPQITNAVQGGSMPAAGCPDGVWDAAQQAKFLADFSAWKAGGFQP